MTSSTPFPRWGWTIVARAWFTGFGALAAMGLIAIARSPDGPPAPPPVLVVDPNTAPLHVLNALPRLGPVLVGRLVAARQQSPFRSLADLDVRVKGIGPATIKALSPHLHIEPSERTTSPAVAALAPVPTPTPTSTSFRVARSP